MEFFRKIYFHIYCNGSQGHFKATNEDKTMIIVGVTNIKVPLTRAVLLVSRISSSKRTKEKWREKKKKRLLASLGLSETYSPLFWLWCLRSLPLELQSGWGCKGLVEIIYLCVPTHDAKMIFLPFLYLSYSFYVSSVLLAYLLVIP